MRTFHLMRTRLVPPFDNGQFYHRRANSPCFKSPSLNNDDNEQGDGPAKSGATMDRISPKASRRQTIFRRQFSRDIVHE